MVAATRETPHLERRRRRRRQRLLVVTPHQANILRRQSNVPPRINLIIREDEILFSDVPPVSGSPDERFSVGIDSFDLDVIRQAVSSGANVNRIPYSKYDPPVVLCSLHPENFENVNTEEDCMYLLGFWCIAMCMLINHGASLDVGYSTRRFHGDVVEEVITTPRREILRNLAEMEYVTEDHIVKRLDYEVSVNAYISSIRRYLDSV